MNKIIPGKEVILLSDESMKVVEDLIANPPTPSAKLRELMNRPQRAKISDVLFLNPVPKHDNDDRTFMSIVKDRRGGTGHMSLSVLAPADPSYKPLLDVGVPIAMAQKLNLQLMVEHLMTDREGSFKDAIKEMAGRIKLNRGNWCAEVSKPMKPGAKVWGERIEGYMQLAVYQNFLKQGLYEHAAFKRMQELKEDIKFYADALNRDIEIKNEGDKIHWLTWGTLTLHVVSPFLDRGVVDHSKIVFFYETKAKLNLS